MLNELGPESGSAFAPESGPQFSTRAVLDVAEVDESGALRVSGWALAEVPIVVVQVYGDGVRLGSATYGLLRPDVGSLHPRYPRAGASGFAFLMAGAPQPAPRVVELELLHEDGGSSRISFPTRASKIGARPSDVLFHTDQAYSDSQGYLNVTGWAAAKTGIDRIEVLVEGTVVGETQCTIARPDVRAAHPVLVTQQNTGFGVRCRLDAVPTEGFPITVRALTTDGRSAEFSVFAEANVPALEPEVIQAALDEEVRIFVDAPVAVDGVVHDTVRDRIALVGWALARQGIDRIEVRFDDVVLGDAYYGVRRQDIERAFPDREGALLSGFAFTVPLQVLKDGHHVLTLIALDKTGQTGEVAIKVHVDKSASEETKWGLRTKVPYAETAALLKLASRSAPLPQFTLAIPLVRRWHKGLLRTLRSIHAQSYAQWQVLLAHDLPKAELREVKATLAALPEESRILTRLVPRASVTWKHVALGKKSFCAVLSPGDVLAADALMQYTLRLQDDPGTEFVYADERRRDPAAGRVMPFFKPGWSPNALFSFNYIGCAWIASLETAKRSFPDAKAFLFGGDYDRVLRLTESAKKIERVARLLAEHSNTSESRAAEQRALRQALRRSGEKGDVVSGSLPGFHRVRRELVRPGKVSIIIPTIAARGLIKRCIDSIRKKSTFKDVEIVLLDNIRRPDKKWKTWFKRNADKVVFIDEPFNWSRFNNIGKRNATGDYLLFLNDDVEVIDPDWLESLLEHAQRESVGVVGPKLLYPDGKVQHAGLFLARNGTARHAFRFASKDDPGYFGLGAVQREMIGVTGACMLMRREVFDRLGGFDESHAVVNNDVDFCLRCHDAGLRVIYTPHACLYHHELASRAELDDTYDTSSFLGAWETLFLKGDPYFNPNLSFDSDDYALDPEPLQEVYAGYPIAAKSSIRRILIVKLDHIGDFVTAIPAIHQLKELFPHSSITALVGPSVAPLASTDPAIDEVQVFSFFHVRSGLGKTELTSADLENLRQTLEPKGFDLAIDLRKSTDTRHVLRYTGARLTAGFDTSDECGWLDIALRWEGDPKFEQKRMHVAGDLLNLVSVVANAMREDRTLMKRPPRSALPAAIRKVSHDLFTKPVVCVHPASGSELRQWPAEYFAKLIDLLVTRLDVHVAVIGGPDEAELAARVLDAVTVKRGVWSVVGSFKLSELPAVLGASSLFVGNNSGPKHVAAAVGVPTVAVHSSVISSEEWGPLGPQAVALRRRMECGPCYLSRKEECHRSLACLTAIEPWHVLGVCKRFLGASGDRSLQGENPRGDRRVSQLNSGS